MAEESTGQQQPESTPVHTMEASEDVMSKYTNNCICGMPDDELFMIICDICTTWYHGRCVGVTASSANDILEYHCPRCERLRGPSLVREKRKSGRAKLTVNYADVNNGISPLRNARIFELLQTRTFLESHFRNMDGHDFDLEYVQTHGFREPVLFRSTAGLEMKMPHASITVMEIATMVGDRPIEVMDVNSQDSIPGWTLFQWARYFTNPLERKKLLNVISFEISDTELASMIVRPRIVRDLDWIEKYWPKTMGQNEFPKVQLYCLMSPAECWTDFHVDFGGTSVFYHLLSGAKVFYMIEPSPKNLELYERWCQSPDQSSIFFPDLVRACHRVQIEAGTTLIIPSGWIHAVYTPRDSIVIGGNFLHDFSIPNQVAVYELEMRCNVQPKFRFPFYEKLCWYATMALDLKLSHSADRLSTEEVDGMQALGDFMYKRLMRVAKPKKCLDSFPTDTSDCNAEEKKLIRDSIPDTLKEKDAYKDLLKRFALKIADFKINALFLKETSIGIAVEIVPPIISTKRKRIPDPKSSTALS